MIPRAIARRSFRSRRRPPSRLRLPLVLALTSFLGLTTGGNPAQSQAFCSPELPIFWQGLSGELPRANNCFGSTGFRCYDPEKLGPFARPQGTCDPATATNGCTVELGAGFEFPGTADMVEEDDFGGFPSPEVVWRRASDNQFLARCGQDALGEIRQDRIETFATFGGVTCLSARLAAPTSFNLQAISCRTGCTKTALETVTFGGREFAEMLGCDPFPLPATCPESSCNTCQAGVPIDGGGAQANETNAPATGPKATLRYAAGGVGGAGTPGQAAHAAALGRYWTHDYAERIVADPDEDNVWLLTKFGSFRQFTGLSGGTYTQVLPTDEYRTLTHLAPGWRLSDLEGTVTEFDAGGLWLSTTDRNGNATTASYDASGQLETVTFPDGRTEEFTYAASGKLETITEVGVDGTSTLMWTYTWTGEDLTRIDRPDGTSLRFEYEDPRHPGFLTQIVLIGTQGGERVERAWKYDTTGSAVATWQGSVVAGTNGPEPGPAAVELWQLSFDDPTDPTVTTITDPLGLVSTRQLERDPAGKVRVTSISGDCPTCGSGPNAQFEYGDTDNPMKVTLETDGTGNQTAFEYDANGRMTRRLEAVDDASLTRETVWTYDATFPALVASITRPSVTGGPESRVTTFTRDANGNTTAQVEEGVEDGVAFMLTTSRTYSAEGRATTIDPPGFGTDDETTFTFDAARGGQVMASRTEPLIGTTSFGYDPFNRRTSVTDPNGVETTTAYDALDRVTTITQEGATDPEDLVTVHEYTEFGDLLRTTLPAGNVIEYDYDSAGRLVSIERKPDASTPAERTLFTLDAAGNRVGEELQAWDGESWITFSETHFEYPTRCFLERTIRSPGTAEEAITESAYDCDGQLERTWDANHPRFVDGSEQPASQSFEYDALDRLVTLTQPWAGGGDAVTTYGYGVQDHLVAVTDAEGSTTTWEYSDRDLMTEEDSPVTGVTTFAYNEHGELVSKTDARGITVNRAVDVLDRVTAVTYPTQPALDTTYTYDDPAVDFSAGRLTAITRHGESVDYRYDRFGRVTQDGDLTMAHDANGNVTSIGYPGSVSATWTHDFADRPLTLAVQVGSDPAQNIVTGATYLPSGPLATLTLGNTTTETRLHDGRYTPTAILLDGPAPRSWLYKTDPVGNILEIQEHEGCAELPVELSGVLIADTQALTTCSGVTADTTTVTGTGDLTLTAGTRIAFGDGFRVETGGRLVAGTDATGLGQTITRSYTYQDFHYFLDTATGPWGTLAWSFDKIGNRLTETTNGAIDTYTYAPNAALGNTALLTQIQLGAGGTRDFQSGPAGHLEQVTAGANVIDFTSDAEGRLSQLDRITEQAPFSYDGRSYLRTATDASSGDTTEPSYSSDGLLHGLRRVNGGTEERITYLHFAGRPVAQLKTDAGGSTLTWLTTDHLGTPVLATDDAGAEVWDANYSPFGQDLDEGLPEGALANEMYLRFPGQWDDGRWGTADLGAEVFYNVHRWYLPGVGRYGRGDPLGLFGGPHLLGYARQNPVKSVDPLGLATWTCTGVGGEISLLAGASFKWGTCKSDCSLGSRWVIDYNWRQFGFGLGIKGSLPVSGSIFSFDDGAPFANPNNFRFGNRLCSTGIAAALGIGFSISSTQFAQPGGPIGTGGEGGFGLSGFTGCGPFKPSNPRRECCDVAPPADGPPLSISAGDPRIPETPSIGPAP